jgi:hypothetical protein
LHLPGFSTVCHQKKHVWLTIIFNIVWATPPAWQHVYDETWLSLTDIHAREQLLNDVSRGFNATLLDLGSL